jgi:glycosyltransferase involved in cell wall biosynthesis
MSAAPLLLFRTLLRSIQKLLQSGQTIDLIDAHYFYPDGVAAVWAANHFRIPVVVTARGTDISLIPKFTVPRRLIEGAARNANGIIAVCDALKSEMVALGIDADRITVLRNGVDLDKFRPGERASARAHFGLERRVLASVGHLIKRKGHHHVIAALPHLNDTDLLIVGDGPERRTLERLAVKLGVANRVRFLGALTQEELARLYNAIDALVLASSREGWANVLLESMACGTPVAASAVWGTPEVVAVPEAGTLMPSVDAAGVVVAVRELFRKPRDRAATRRYAEGFSWDATTRGQLELFSRLLRNRAEWGR